MCEGNLFCISQCRDGAALGGSFRVGFRRQEAAFSGRKLPVWIGSGVNILMFKIMQTGSSDMCQVLKGETVSALRMAAIIASQKPSTSTLCVRSHTQQIVFEGTYGGFELTSPNRKAV